MKRKDMTRRAFLATTTLAASQTGCAAAHTRVAVNDARVVPGRESPNERLNVAAIGAGGQGFGDIMSCRSENIVALCDVDWDRTQRTFNELPDAKVYRDFRNMLEEMPEIDAVTISTPDHTHAPAAIMAMQMGKHVYVQKPLTHTVQEARWLTLVAREHGVATQMGNQGHSGNGVRELCEMIWTGAIGQVREAHVWTHRPVWDYQGTAEPLPAQVAPENMDWDRWIGPAPMRPYNQGYAPRNWRAWLDFGGGALGDMACHIMDPVYMSLKLVEASDYTVEVVMQEGRNEQTFPVTTTVKYSFPARGDMAPVDVYWYDGHWPDPDTGERVYNRPPHPEGVPEDQELGDNNMNGSYLVGDDGIITTGEYGGRPRLLPDEKMADYTMPDPFLDRVEGQLHHRDWLRACKDGRPASSNFEYAGPFTEMVNFGNLVVMSGEKLHWDNERGVVTNVDNPEEIVSKEYRKGWELPV